MAVVPAPPDFDFGVSSPSQLNQLRDAIKFTLNRPICRAMQTVAQSLPTGAFTSLTFDAESVDQGNGSAATQHDTVTNNSRFTANWAGWYQVAAACGFAASATGRRGMRLAVNGTAVNGSSVMIQASAASTINVTAGNELVFLAVGDYVEAQAFQDTGGALLTIVVTENQPRMNVVWVSN